MFASLALVVFFGALLVANHCGHPPGSRRPGVTGLCARLLLQSRSASSRRRQILPDAVGDRSSGEVVLEVAASRGPATYAIRRMALGPVAVESDQWLAAKLAGRPADTNAEVVSPTPSDCPTSKPSHGRRYAYPLPAWQKSANASAAIDVSAVRRGVSRERGRQPGGAPRPTPQGGPRGSRPRPGSAARA